MMQSVTSNHGYVKESGVGQHESTMNSSLLALDLLLQTEGMPLHVDQLG